MQNIVITYFFTMTIFVTVVATVFVITVYAISTTDISSHAISEVIKSLWMFSISHLSTES